ncbi:MAG: hypothetical protein KatS3mg110_4385 [Pirellulaceae bacterium]|nr:MAG: hypothetical protein KatS3mg110_4385 [Pirellulaceae bacterium]
MVFSLRAKYAIRVAAAAVLCVSVTLRAEEKKKVVFIAGRPSHGYGAHEHFAGCTLLARALEQGMPNFTAVVVRNGWPEDKSILEDADAIVIYADGGGGHPVLPHLQEVDRLAERGVGIVCIHYAVEVPKGEPGNYFLKWIGGYFETYWSVNPHWLAKFEKLPEHPITRGVKPFAIDDEWYYHMRFRPDMEGVTPILTAVPPASTLNRPDGPHSGNPYVRAKVGQPQHVAWATERPDGGRGFGFTGGHFHWNWGDPNFRKLVLNAIVWAARAEVPAEGVPLQPVTLKDLEANQDYPPPANFDREAIRKRLGLPPDEPSPGDSQKSPPGAASGSSGRGDVRPLFRSPVITSQTPGHSVAMDVPLAGAGELYLVVTDAGDGYSCDWADWIEPRLVGPAGEKKLTEIRWKRATAAWGQVQVNRNAAGGPLRVAGQPVEYGIGTHAYSVIAFDVPEGYERLVGRVGLDEGGTSQSGCGAAASVQFFVYSSPPPPPAAGPSSRHDPELAVAALDVADGLEATLFASEPQLLSVTNLDIDARGRVWVCEVVNYRRHNGERPEGDRILILEDHDHDGRADQVKVYYQGRDVDSAMGICVLGNRVIVSASPKILIFTDEDGDDRPDKKEVFFDYTGQPQHDHSAHTFLFGPDGKLYWNFGNTGQKVCRPDGSVVKDLFGRPVVDDGKPFYGGMVFRCEPDGSRFEVLAHNFRNNYEVTVDSFGNLWQSDNDDDGNRGVRINFVMEYGNYGYRDELTGAGWQSPRTDWEEEIPRRHWHQNDPGVVPNLLHTGAGSPTGITVYEGRLLPERFWDQVIHCDAGPNVVRAYRVEPEGAGYRARIENLVHGARDNWFRPADVCVAPDGSIFITDWYDPGVGGHNMVDMERGRIFRVAPPGHPYRIPKFDFQTVAGACAALRNPNYAVRYLAFTALINFGSQAVPALEQMATTDGEPRMRARALWVLGKLAGQGRRAVQLALKDPHPQVRIVGIRLARQLEIPFVPLWNEFLRDESDRHVLRECAIALHRRQEQGTAQVWAHLALKYQPGDRWYLEALGIGADQQWDACCQAWLEMAGQDVLNTQAGRDIVWRSRASQTAQWLVKIIRQGSGQAGPLARYFRALDFQKAENRNQALLKLWEARKEWHSEDRALVLVELLARLEPSSLADTGRRNEVFRELLELPRDERFVQLVGRWQAEPLYPELLRVAVEHGEPNVRVEALRQLLRREQISLLTNALHDEDRTTATRLIEVLGLAADGRSSSLLVDLAKDPSQDLELRRKAVIALGRSQAGTRWMIREVEQGTLDLALKEAVAQALHGSPIAEARAAGQKLFPLPAGKENQPLPPVDRLASLSGDAARGRELFRTTGQCANCHRVGSEGKAVGPALNDIGAKLSRQALIESILFPSAGISHNYETYAVATADGEVITGLLVSRTNEELLLKTQEALVRRLAMRDVESIRKLEVSLMPADLAKQLSAQDLVDLVEYLATLRGESSSGP